MGQLVAATPWPTTRFQTFAFSQKRVTFVPLQRGRRRAVHAADVADVVQHERQRWGGAR
jgi:hypothetical protein